MNLNTTSAAAIATADARVKMLKFWAAEIRYPAGRAAVFSFRIAGPFRHEIRMLQKAARREERRATRHA